jgi:peptidoglycan/LPS O-acetylase OafA/YrhL
MIRRFGRLWPLHICVLSVFVLFELTKVAFVKFHLAVPQPLFSNATGTSLHNLVENIFLVQAVGIDPIPSWNGPSWSISTEFWTYLVFAIVCLAGNKRSIALVAATIALISAAIVAKYAPYVMYSTFDFGLLRCFCGFFIGHLVYRIWSSGSIKLKYPVIMEITALTLVVLFSSWVQPDLGSLPAPFIFGFAVWVFAFEAGPISKLMRHRALLAVGAWSYSIYMIHVFIITIMEKFGTLATRLSGAPGTVKVQYVPIGPPDYFIFFGSKWAMDVLVLFYILFVMSIAALTYRYIEQPGRRYFNRLARTWFGETGSAA